MDYSIKKTIEKPVFLPNSPKTWSPLLKIGQVSQILNISIWSLRQWDKKNILKPIRIGNRNGVGDRRYRKEDVIKAMNEGI